MRRVVTGGRLRRRLAVTYALVAAIATGALALGTYLVVSSARLDDSVEGSLAQARTNFVLAGTVLEGSPRRRTSSASSSSTPGNPASRRSHWSAERCSRRAPP